MAPLSPIWRWLVLWHPETRRGMMVRECNASGCEYERRAMSSSDQEHWTIAAADSRGNPLVRFHIDADRGIIFVQLFGVLTLDSIAAYRQASRVDAKFDPSFNTLVDLTVVDEWDLSASDVAEMMTVLSRMKEKRTGRLALVSGPDLGRISFMRMYVARAEHLNDRQVAAFDSIEEAMTWLEE